MYKDLIKNYIKNLITKNKKNVVPFIVIALIAAAVIIKFALPLLSALGLIALCLVAWYFIKRKSKVQVQVGGDNSKMVQYTNDKGTTVQVQKGGDNSEQVQIYKD